MTAGKYQAPRGTYDVLPREAAARRRICMETRRLLETAGYGELETPAFEQTELFTRSVGEATDIVRKEMYTFEDQGGRSLTLRPEGTAPVCRAYIQHGMQKLPQPVKLWYAGPMFRYEAPQSGRFRQHYQVGAEAIGSADVALDVELIALLSDLLRDLGIDQVRLKVSSIGDRCCRPQYVEELREALLESNSFSAEQHERIKLNPLRAFDWTEPEAVAAIEAAPSMLDRLCDECRSHLDELGELLREMGIAFELDSRLVRGLDYYTRTVFEFTCDLLGAQSGLGGGGRYDGLVEQLGGGPTPAAGWAAGIERILLAMERSRSEGGPAAGGRPAGDRTTIATDVFVALAEASVRAKAVRLVSDLRKRGIGADMEYAGRSLKGQMKHAGRSGARLVLILGPDELGRGVVAIRDMGSGEQIEHPLNGVVDEIGRRLGDNPAGG